MSQPFPLALLLFAVFAVALMSALTELNGFLTRELVAATTVTAIGEGPTARNRRRARRPRPRARRR